ncbi:uncharacterized protein H6S33_006477 [Morchella sextelata]|uniref:uncharacterized protein n=1 Tax=Morchella sextelata TaxID=1174677 RepID=UPI001D05166D|nr:uncharacterized protein H6S33_006477 [Morchella sextelata]KAH0604809.1 hypothetical protein H6S33_006477 [Morchella sextelata]
MALPYLLRSWGRGGRPTCPIFSIYTPIDIWWDEGNKLCNAGGTSRRSWSESYIDEFTSLRALGNWEAAWMSGETLIRSILSTDLRHVQRRSWSNISIDRFTSSQIHTGWETGSRETLIRSMHVLSTMYAVTLVYLSNNYDTCAYFETGIPLSRTNAKLRQSSQQGFC